MSEQKLNGTATRPTKETYDQLQYAYDRLNSGLFGGELPNCLITLQRRKGTYGHFGQDRYARDCGQVTDEISLNPAYFRERPIEEVLATLAHEMVHLWQHHFGKAGRGRYHNRQWAEKMKEIGLQPSDTGEEGGKETGDKVHHFIIGGGAFEKTANRLLARDFSITWMEKTCAASADGSEAHEGDEDDKKSKSGKRIKYVCAYSECELKAWAKHDAMLVCGIHMTPMEPSS